MVYKLAKIREVDGVDAQDEQRRERVVS